MLKMTHNKIKMIQVKKNKWSNMYWFLITRYIRAYGIMDELRQMNSNTIFILWLE